MVAAGLTRWVVYQQVKAGMLVKFGGLFHSERLDGGCVDDTVEETRPSVLLTLCFQHFPGHTEK